MKIFRLNLISWIQILSAGITNAVFLISNIRHEYYLDFIILFFVSALLFLWGITCSEEASRLFYWDQRSFNKLENFKINFYAMNAAVVVFIFIYLGIEISFFHNADVSGWIDLLALAIALEGLVLSLLFASIACFFRPHKIYTPVIIVIIFMGFMVWFLVTELFRR